MKKKKNRGRYAVPIPAVPHCEYPVIIKLQFGVLVMREEGIRGMAGNSRKRREKLGSREKP